MKTKVFLFAIAIIGTMLTACQKDDLHVVPGGKVESETIQVSGISKIEIEDLFEVVVTFSETEESVVVEADENLMSLIEVAQIGETFFAELDDDVQINGVPHLKLYIKTSTLTKIKATGAVSVKIENTLRADKINLDIEGASNFTGTVDVNEVVAQLSGASDLKLKGTSDSFDIVAEGASEMTDYDFETNSLDANLNGGCEISLTVHQKLNVDAEGASKVYYKGTGIIENQKLRDASEIVKVD